MDDVYRLRERALHWRQMALSFTDKQALNALNAMADAADQEADELDVSLMPKTPL